MRELIEHLEALTEARAEWKKHGGGKKAWWTLSKPWGFYIVRSLGGGDKPKWAAIYEPAKPGTGPLGKGGCIDSGGKVPSKHVDHPDMDKAKAAVNKHVENVKELALTKGGDEAAKGSGEAIKKKSKEKAEGDKIDDATKDAEDQLKKLKGKEDKVTADDLKAARGVQKAADAAAAPTYASGGEMPGKGGVGVQTLGKARSWLAKLAAKLGDFIKGVADRRNERKKNEG